MAGVIGVNQLAGAWCSWVRSRLSCLSEGQVRRSLNVVRSDGAPRLIDGNPGQRPGNWVSATGAARVIALATTAYGGFSQHHSD